MQRCWCRWVVGRWRRGSHVMEASPELQVWCPAGTPCQKRLSANRPGTYLLYLVQWSGLSGQHARDMECMAGLLGQVGTEVGSLVGH